MFGSAVGLFLVGFAPETALVMALVGNLLAGMMNVLINGPAFALLQAVVDEDMQGRVMALVLSLANVVTPLGLAIDGTLAEVAGVRIWFPLAGLGFLLAGVVTSVNSAIRSMENEHTDGQATLTAARP